MQSTNFLVATVDRGFNLFKTIQGEIQFIEKIVEHTKRLEEISENQHFYIDEDAFKALGHTNFPLRFTRVFSKNPDAIDQSRNYRIHHIDDLSDVVMSKERYSPQVQIFFIGNSEFLENASKYAKKLLLTAVDRNFDDDPHVTDKFPLEFMKKVFTKRRKIHPEMLEQIKKFRSMMETKRKSQEITVAANGMKFIKEIEIAEIDPNDQILNTPDYMFYEYSR